MGQSTKIWNAGREVNYMQIKIFEGNYDKAEFYSVMGKYFAEPQYRKAMPYMSNKETSVWFLIFQAGELVGFSSLSNLPEKIILESSFVECNFRRQGFWHALNRERLNYAESKNKNFEVITKEPYLVSYWIDRGFEVYRKNGRYSYLRRSD